MSAREVHPVDAVENLHGHVAHANLKQSGVLAWSLDMSVHRRLVLQTFLPSGFMTAKNILTGTWLLSLLGQSISYEMYILHGKREMSF